MRAISWAIVLAVLAFAGTAAKGAAVPATVPAQPSTALYYGNEPPVDMLAQFDRVVVEAEHVTARQLSTLQAHGAQVYAYLSVGERDPDRPGIPTLPKSDILGTNLAWHSQVVDLTSPAWRHYLLDVAIAALWKKGYRGLFLDTLDSYQAHVHDTAGLARQRKALASLIKAMHARYPGIHLLLNRGFAVLPQVHADVDGVAAESLFLGWNQAKQHYVEVAPKDREWLLGQLRKVRDEYHLPVTVIDYLPPAKRDEARKDARRIASLGFTPWVTNAALDQVGVGLIEVMPRKVLMLYSKANPGDLTDDISNYPIHWAAAMPLEYFGYVPVYHEMHKPLPEGSLKGQFAGIVSWFSGPVPDPKTYRHWLLRQLDDGVPAAMFGNPGLALNGSLLQRMGLRKPAGVDVRNLHIKSHDPMLGFEGMRDVVPLGEDGYLPARDDVRAHLTLCDDDADCLAPVLTGDWGGLALDPWVLQSAPVVGQVGLTGDFFGAQSRWLLDPFRFLRTALHLQPMPMVDPTTENGNRIASAHIDGDGFANRANLPGSPFAGKVVFDKILKRYDFPVTVSVIEGETGPQGLYPELSPQLEKIARSIFRLPNVEVATHTYSHPLDWLQIKPGMISGKYNLPIPDYRFSFERDIDGSVNYVNHRLAPPGKKVKVVLWSGDAVPPLPAMQRVDKLGLLQINGGNTKITHRYDSLLNVSPMTRPVGPYHQILAPDINEEVYTNGYHGPYWGFRQVIQTFKLTDMPRRLKPMSIYFHFFSGTHIAAIDALEKTFSYVMGQPVLPMFESTYCRIVADFRQIGMARSMDGAWIISGADQDRTLRLPPGLWPDLAKSHGVVGVRDLPQGRYVALSGVDKVRLVLRPQPPSVPYLVSANGRVVDWQRDGHGFHLRLRGRVPLKLELAGLGKSCRLVAAGASRHRLTNGNVVLKYRGTDSGDIRVACH